jgi:competence protein CoiA-like protein
LQYALDATDEKIQAVRGLRARCPVCLEPVYPRCGSVKVHHWAHEARKDCDPWWESETEWHRGWKALVPPECREVTMGPHRADIVSPNGLVVELQHSPLSPIDIEAREKFYRRMIWVLDAAPFASRLFLFDRYPGSAVFKIRWKSQRISWLAARRTLFLDLGEKRMSELMGKKAVTYGDNSGRPPQWRIVRDESGGGGGDESILEIKTLHEGGWGSARGLSKAEFLARIGIS